METRAYGFGGATARSNCFQRFGMFHSSGAAVQTEPGSLDTGTYHSLYYRPAQGPLCGSGSIYGTCSHVLQSPGLKPALCQTHTHTHVPCHPRSPTKHTQGLLTIHTGSHKLKPTFSTTRPHKQRKTQAYSHTHVLSFSLSLSAHFPASME